MMHHLQGNWNIPEIIETNRFVILHFSTNTCKPCIAIAHKLDEWSNMHEDIYVLHIPLESYIAEATQMSIMSAPTVCTYVDGKQIEQKSGYFSLDQILSNFERQHTYAL